MPYAKVITPVGEALVALELSNWRASYQTLFDQTDVSGWEVWLAYRHNNFNNPLQQTDKQRYKQRYNDRRGWAEIFRDIVREGGRGTDGKGRLNIDYISHAGTAREQTHSEIWAPKTGWYVPTEDGIFVPETLVPFETLQNRGEAINRLKAKGISSKQVSYFWRPDKYNKEERFVGRRFGPGLRGGGRFDVLALGLPSSSGDDRVASRPAYVDGSPAEIVMEVCVA